MYLLHESTSAPQSDAANVTAASYGISPGVGRPSTIGTEGQDSTFNTTLHNNTYLSSGGTNGQALAWEKLEKCSKTAREDVNQSKELQQAMLANEEAEQYLADIVELLGVTDYEILDVENQIEVDQRSGTGGHQVLTADERLRM